MHVSYKQPVVEIVCLERNDVITTSGSFNGENDYQDPFGDNDEGGVPSWQ